MEAVLKKLVLKRFRSIPSGAIEFDNPTFLVGKNGSGKSNLVDAFEFLSDAMSSPLQAVFAKRAGLSSVRNRTSARGAPANLGLRVELEGLNENILSAHYAFEVRALPGYAFEVLREQCLARSSDGNQVWFERKQQQFSTSVEGLKPSLDPTSLGLLVVGGDDRFSPILRFLSSMRTYSIEPTKLREMQEPDSGVALRRDGANAASVLQEIQRHTSDDTGRICEILSTIVPNTTAVKPKKHGNKLSLEFTQEWQPQKKLRFEGFNMSDGTLRALGLLTAVYQRPIPTVLVIEEPEATIHPGALGAVLDLLKHAASKMQVIVTTHSPEVLDAEWIKDSHLRVIDWKEGETKVAPLSDASRKALRQHLMGAGDLLRANALHPQELFEEDVAQGKLFETIKDAVII